MHSAKPRICSMMVNCWWTQAGSLTLNGSISPETSRPLPRWSAGLRQTHRTMQRLAAPLGQMPLQRRPPTACGLLPLRRQEPFHAQSPRPLSPALTAAASGPREPAAETSAKERKSSAGSSVSSDAPPASEQVPQAVEAPGVPGFQPPDGERPLWW